jgi:KinB signaling pathway activation protein
MRLDRFLFLLLSTVVLGAIVGILTSVSGLFIHVYWYTGMIEGGFLATTSLMGFWAYLTLNFIARITLPRRVWRWMQMLILALVLYDMFYVRYHVEHLRHTDVSYTPYLIQAAWPLGVAFIGAFAKRKLSGKGSFLPSLFFLYVFTVVDWLLVIWYKNGAIVNQTGIIMMACNVYLLLIYGKLLSRTPNITDIQVTTAKTSFQGTHKSQ